MVVASGAPGTKGRLCAEIDETPRGRRATTCVRPDAAYDGAMPRSKATRRLVALAAVASLVLGVVIPGSIAYAAGMIAFLLLPLLVAKSTGAVAIDHGVRFGIGRNGDQRLDLVARCLGVCAFAAFAYFSPSLDGMALGIFGLLIGNACAFLAAIGLLSMFIEAPLSEHAVTLEDETLTIHDANGTKVVSYAELRKVEVEGRCVALTTATDRHLVRVAGGAKVAARLARIITEAKANATPAQADDGPMKELRRPSGMGAREWLDRIDAVAAASRSPGAYRGTALDEDHLWTVLANEEEQIEARAAAARVLASSEDPALRVRVETSVKEIADDRARIRVALAMKTDTDAAAAELDALEMEELRKDAGV
ncbi:MAG: hypothetical protein JWP87_4042 [Labilithrix sp.]|nr:hypothetical protein [Labilithrix sp.]